VAAVQTVVVGLLAELLLKAALAVAGEEGSRRGRSGSRAVQEAADKVQPVAAVAQVAQLSAQ
jgi:hypothetical protein